MTIDINKLGDEIASLPPARTAELLQHLEETKAAKAFFDGYGVWPAAPSSEPFDEAEFDRQVAARGWQRFEPARVCPEERA